MNSFLLFVKVAIPSQHPRTYTTKKRRSFFVICAGQRAQRLRPRQAHREPALRERAIWSPSLWAAVWEQAWPVFHNLTVCGPLGQAHRIGDVPGVLDTDGLYGRSCGCHRLIEYAARDISFIGIIEIHGRPVHVCVHRDDPLARANGLRGRVELRGIDRYPQALVVIRCMSSA